MGNEICKLCDSADYDVMICSECHKEKKTCCESAGAGVPCFACEEAMAE